MAERAADGKIHTTEWEEIQYKHGNKVGNYATHEMEICAQKLAERHIDAPLETHDKLRERLRDKIARGQVDPDEINEDLVDEDREMAEEVLEGEDDEEAIIARFRAARKKQMQEQQATNCFGRIKAISGASYVQEITDASKNSIVVGILMEQNHEGSLDVVMRFAEIAASHPNIKFVTVKSTEAIPNFPVKHLPCVVVYSEGALQAQVTGLEPWCRSGSTKPSLESAANGLRRLHVLPALASESDEEDSYIPRSNKMRIGY